MQQESFWDLALNHNKAWNALLYQLILLYFSKEIVCNDIRLGFGFLVCYYCRGTLLIPKDPCVMRHRKKLNQGEKICRKRNHRIFVCTLLDWSIRMSKCLSCPTRNNLGCHQNSWCTGNSIEFLYLLPRPVEFIPSLHPGGNKCHHFILSFYRRKGSLLFVCWWTLPWVYLTRGLHCHLPGRFHCCGGVGRSHQLHGGHQDCDVLPFCLAPALASHKLIQLSAKLLRGARPARYYWLDLFSSLWKGMIAKVCLRSV